ncbi:MFS transporter [Paenibacillus sp. 2TAB19]|uniref:MFS transporter n=1 Tax=Paenibacillus sp. 2TAB19 TaxID=3233003 RepID=UPI003F973C73
MPDGKKRDLAALASIPLIMTLANSMLIPVLPLMQKKLQISSVQSSLIITLYAVVSIPCIPIAGYLSDRFGRKRIILIGLLLACIGGVVSGLAAWLMGVHAYGMILIGRIIQGIGAAGAFPIVLPLVGDMFKNEEEVSKGLGMIETSNTFGKVLSPILGSALALVVWYLPLAIIPIISLISVILILIFVKAPKSSKSNSLTLKKLFQIIKPIIAREGRWLYAVFTIGGMAMFVMFGFLYFLSTHLEERYHLNGIWKGMLLSIPLIAICLASYLTGKWVSDNKSTMRWCTVAGTTILSAAMIVCGFAPLAGKIFLLSLLFIGGIGIGITLPSLDALITEGIEKEQRGTLSSLYSSARFIGVASGPLVASLLLKHQSSMFYMYGGVGLACALLALWAIKPDQKDKARKGTA